MNIKLKNQTIEYIVHYKKIKSLYLKVKDHKIMISAPFNTPISYIEETIILHQDKIINRLNEYKTYALYQDQGYVYIFNKKYTIILRDMKKRVCSIHDEYLYVYHKDIQGCVESYLKEMLEEYLCLKIKQYLPTYKRNMPTIEVKKYKRRWGCCYYRENKVRFNLYLIHLSKDLIDYVIVHELSHFIVNNHSSLFYKEIEKRMPDYKERIKRLKKEHI